MKNIHTATAVVLVAAMSFGNACASGQPGALPNTVIKLEKIDPDRIVARQKSMATVLDEQSRMRTTSVALLSTAATLTLIGGSWYAYEQYTTPSPTKKAKRTAEVAKNFEQTYHECRLTHFEEMQTVSGIIKHGVRNGFGYAVATIATIALLALLNKVTNVSLPAIRETLYPTTSDLCAIQEQIFKESFDYVQTTLQDLVAEQSKVTTQEELVIFNQWRSMLCTGVQTSVATLVKAVEDFAALSVELAIRAHNTLPKDHAALPEFEMLIRRIDTLTHSINGLSTIIETTINAPDLATLNHSRMQVGMHFKNTIVSAREALHNVVMLVNSI